MAKPATKRATGRREWIVLLAILLGGALLRGFYLTEVVDSPDFRQPLVDALTHDYWARGLATGDWTPPAGMPDPQIQQTPFFRPPAYPYFLAGVYAATGGSALAARIVQMALGLLSVLLIFLVGRRWFGVAPSLWAAAGMSFWWVLLYFEGELLAVSVLLPVLLGAFLFLGRWLHSRLAGDLALASALVGVACLLRPNVLAFLPVTVVWVYWVRRSHPPVTARMAPAPSNFGPLWRALLMAVLPALIVISIATVRNARVSGDFVLISSNGGINLYIGNNPEANGFVASELAGIGRFGTCFDHVRIVRSLEGKLQRPLSHAQVSDWFAGEALRYMREHPGRTLALMWKKACLLWGNPEVGHNEELSLERRYSSALRFLPGPFALLATLAVIGGFLLWRQRQRIDTRLFVLLAGFVVVMLAALLPFFAAARFRVPVLPVLFLFAGVAVHVFVADVRARRLRPASMLLSAALVLLFLQLLLPYHYEPDEAFWHFQRGAAWQAAGDVAHAEQEFRAALQVEPRHYQARHNLATLLAQRGDTQAALQEWQEAVRLQPNQAPILGSIGAALLVEKQPEAALPYFEQAVKLEPDVADFHSNMARALQALGRGTEALKEMRQAALLEPKRPEHWLALAGMAQAEGVTPLMLEGWTEAARLQPDPYLVNNIAWVLATHPDASFRDGPKAVQLATAACNSTDRKVRSFLDTLAAAQAEVGDFDAAVATAQRSLSMAEAEKDAAATAKIRERIELFGRRVAYRDRSLQGDLPEH